MNDYIIFKYINKNNIKKVKQLLNNDKKLLKIIGPNGQMIIHDACLNGNKKMIELLLSYDNKILEIENDLGITSFEILTLYEDLLIYFLKKYKISNINKINNYGINILVRYIMINNKLNYNFIKELIKLGCKIIYSEINPIKYFLKKKCNELEKLNKILSLDFNKLDEFSPISFYLIDYNNVDCFKNLINMGMDINLISKNDNALSYSIIKKNVKFINYLINTDIDKNFCDNFENSYSHLAIINNIDIKLFIKINNFDSNHNKQNIFGDTLLHLIFKLKMWKTYSDIFINMKNIDLTIKNKENKYFYEYDNNYDNNIIKLFKFPNTKKEKNNIKLIKNKIPFHTAFSGHYWTVLSSIHYIISKYNYVGFPICEKYDKNDKKDNIQQYNEFIGNNKCLLCGKIVFENKNSYTIDKNLEKCIKNVIDKEFIIIYLAIIKPTIRHASVIIINNNDLSIERFETYGKFFSQYENDLDIILKEKLSNIMFLLTKNKYKYIKPIDFQNIYDFQHISNETITYINECPGFCVAWIFWYLEHKLINKKISRNNLINNLKNKLIEEKITIIDIIRGYADKLDKYKNKLISTFKIDKKIIYKLHYKDVNLHFVYENLLINLLKVQKIK